MAAKPFNAIMANFKEKTGINLDGKDLKYAEWIYEAHLEMLSDRKRTEPTRQNYGQYVDRMDCKLGHSTMWSRPDVAKFTDFLIELRKPEKKQQPKQEKDESEKTEQEKINERTEYVEKFKADIQVDAILRDYCKTNQQLAQSYEIIKSLKEALRNLGIDPNTINTPAVTVKKTFTLPDGSWVDFATARIRPPGWRKDSNLEYDSDIDIDEQ